MQQPYLYLLTLIALTLALYGCDASKIGEEERNDMVRTSVEEYYRQHTPPDSSYEFVSLTVIDTILYKDNIAFRRNFIQAEIDHNRSMAEIAQQKQDTFQTVNFHEKIVEYQDKLERYERVMTGIDSLEKVLGGKGDEVASYTYLFKCKADNGQGKQIEKVYYVQTDMGFGVLGMTDNKETIFPNPNDFPGYKEMALKALTEQ